MPTDELPAYSVRRSRRARVARLTYHPRDGLTVVVPLRYDERRIGELVSANLAWFHRVRDRLGVARLADPLRDGPRPERLSLRALEEEWTVRYSAPSPRPSLRVLVAGELLLSPAAAGPAGEGRLLAAFLAERARRMLGPRLLPWAEQLGVADRLTEVKVRAQRSRWGSCSARGTITLNRNLLFLPPELVGLVLAHEACHLRELNHSPRFWALLASCEPRADRLRRELRSAWLYVPPWAEPPPLRGARPQQAASP